MSETTIPSGALRIDRARTAMEYWRRQGDKWSGQSLGPATFNIFWVCVREVSHENYAICLLACCRGAFSGFGTAVSAPRNCGIRSREFVTFKGTVTDFEFINPHAQLFFDVKDDKGNIEKWEGEITSPSQLARGGGWTRESLKPGDQITVVGNRAKNGSYTMRVQKVILADGTALKIGGGDN